eukprot:561165-Hanusia_phi.AAC.3
MACSDGSCTAAANLLASSTSHTAPPPSLASDSQLPLRISLFIVQPRLACLRLYLIPTLITLNVCPKYGRSSFLLSKEPELEQGLGQLAGRGSALTACGSSSSSSSSQLAARRMRRADLSSTDTAARRTSHGPAGKRRQTCWSGVSGRVKDASCQSWEEELIVAKE